MIIDLLFMIFYWDESKNNIKRNEYNDPIWIKLN